MYLSQILVIRMTLYKQLCPNMSHTSVLCCCCRRHQCPVASTSALAHIDNLFAHFSNPRVYIYARISSSADRTNIIVFIHSSHSHSIHSFILSFEQLSRMWLCAFYCQCDCHICIFISIYTWRSLALSSALVCTLPAWRSLQSLQLVHTMHIALIVSSSISTLIYVWCVLAILYSASVFLSCDACNCCCCCCCYSWCYMELRDNDKMTLSGSLSLSSMK